MSQNEDIFCFMTNKKFVGNSQKKKKADPIVLMKKYIIIMVTS